MDIIISGRTTHALIKRPRFTLTIDEGFTDLFVIPLAIDPLHGESNVFRVCFQKRGPQIAIVASRIFEDIHTSLTPKNLSAEALSNIQREDKFINLYQICLKFFFIILNKYLNNFFFPFQPSTNTAITDIIPNNN